MNRTKLRQIAHDIAAMACGDAPVDRNALYQKACDLNRALDDQMFSESSAMILETQSPVSSVEIASRQKGEPAITVKSYHADIEVARDMAVRIYNETVAQFKGSES